MGNESSFTDCESRKNPCAIMHADYHISQLNVTVMNMTCFISKAKRSTEVSLYPAAWKWMDFSCYVSHPVNGVTKRVWDASGDTYPIWGIQCTAANWKALWVTNVQRERRLFWKDLWLYMEREEEVQGKLTTLLPPWFVLRKKKEKVIKG